MPEARDNLTDGALQSEIELVGDLVVAATSSEGPLPQSEIDRLLGLKAGEEPAPEAGEEPAPKAGEQPAPKAGEASPAPEPRGPAPEPGS